LRSKASSARSRKNGVGTRRSAKASSKAGGKRVRERRRKSE
jgi:hypothetical protein